MTENRKYFGLTTTQIGILAGLGGVVCLLFSSVAWLMYGNRSAFSLPDAPTGTPMHDKTATSLVPPPATSTPTPQPVPYETLIPAGWTQYRSALVELWLPPGFKSADAKILRADLANFAIPELILSGTISKLDLYPIVVVVAFEPLTANSLDAFLDREIPKLSSDINVTERRRISVNSVEASRLILETRVENLDNNTLLYVFLDGGTIWYVEYNTQINQFYELLPTFEESVRTFRIVR